MTRIVEFAPEEFYHLYNRGTERRDIFTSSADRERFLALLYLCNQPRPVDLKVQGRTLLEIENPKEQASLVDIVCYCLMPSHFHLLVREHSERNISKFMQKLCTGYTMYFNKQHERSGVLFQGKFKATHVNNDRYLQYLISYIHLNPIKLLEPNWKETGIIDRKGAERYLENYAYSSYLDYLGRTRPANMLLERSVLPEYFSTGTDFKSFVTDWLSYTSE